MAATTRKMDRARLSMAPPANRPAPRPVEHRPVAAAAPLGPGDDHLVLPVARLLPQRDVEAFLHVGDGLRAVHVALLAGIVEKQIEIRAHRPRAARLGHARIPADARANS